MAFTPLQLNKNLTPGFTPYTPLPTLTKIEKYQVETKKLEEEARKQASFGGILKNTLKGIGQTGVNIVKDFGTNLYDTWRQTPTKIAENIQSGAEDSIAGNPFKSVLKAGGRTAGDVAIALYAPLSAAIGSVLNNLGGQKIIDNIGEVVADKSGITDVPAFQKFAMEHPNAGEDFNRILTLLMAKGEKGKIEPARLYQETKTFVDKIVPKEPPKSPLKVPVQSQTPFAEPIKVNTPQTKFQEYQKLQGYEPIIPNEKLPVIEAGGKEKPTLPIIQTLSKTSKAKNDFVYEPIKSTMKVPVEAPIKPKTAPETTIIPKTQNIPPRVDGLKTSKVARSIETKTVEKGLAEGFNDIAGYDPITIKDQASRASKVMEDINKATKMVKGEIPMESGLKGEMLIKAMEDHAQATGNVRLLQDIANSPLVSETSAHAQAMRILAERNPDSVVAKLREVKLAREAKVQNKDARKSVLMEQLKGEKLNIPKEELAWDKFLNEIVC